MPGAIQTESNTRTQGEHSTQASQTSSTQSTEDLKIQSKGSKNREEIRKEIANAAPLVETVTKVTQRGDGFLMGFVKGFNQSKDYAHRKTEEIEKTNIGGALDVKRHGLPRIEISPQKSDTDNRELRLVFNRNTSDLEAAYLFDPNNKESPATKVNAERGKDGTVSFNFGDIATISPNATLVVENKSGDREHISLKELRDRAEFIKEATSGAGQKK